jgi:hypothetical protein
MRQNGENFGKYEMPKTGWRRIGKIDMDICPLIVYNGEEIWDRTSF